MKHAPGFLKLVESVMPGVHEVSVEEVFAAMKEQEASFELSAMRGSGDPQRAQYMIIDVREDNEWDKGHIKGAIHLGRGIIERDIENTIPDKNTTLVLYCGGGYRSALAAENLQKMGYRRVFSMAGGWSEWNKNGFPTG